MAFTGVNNVISPCYRGAMPKELSSSPPTVPGALFGGRGAKHRQLEAVGWEDFMVEKNPPKEQRKIHPGRWTAGN